MISYDSKWIAMSQKEKVEIRDLENPDKVYFEVGMKSTIYDFSKDSKLFVIAEVDNDELSLFSLDTKQIIKKLNFEKKIGDISFSPCGRFLAVGQY